MTEPANPLPEAAAALTGRPPANTLSGAGVTATTALVAGILILTKGALPTRNHETDYSSLAWLAVTLGAVALALVLIASYEWPAPQGEQPDRWNWIRKLFGANGAAARLSSPIGWIAAAVAAVVVATIALPQLSSGLKADLVFAAGLLVLTLLALLGWGPTVTRAWPTGLKLSPLTVLGSVVALALVAAYLFFLWILAGKTGAEADEWARLVELRATLEALAFAAAGALIGQTVARSAATGQLQEKEATIANQAKVNEGKQDALLGALDLLTPADVVIGQGAAGESLRVAAEAPLVRDAARIREARNRLVDGLRVGR
jgi:hypothetical protein